MRRQMAVLAVVVCCLVGCFWREAADVAIAELDGRKLTCSDCEAKIALRLKLFRLANPAADEETLSAYETRLRRSAVDRFVEESVVHEESARLKISAHDDEVCVQLDRFAPLLDRLTRDERTLLNAAAREEALACATRQAWMSSCEVSVSPEELQAAQVRVAEYEALVAATNAAVYARATNAWMRLVAGEPFVSVARQFNEAEGLDPADIEWGDFRLTDLADERDLVSAIDRLSVGDFTPPVQGDNGLMIVRMVARGNEDPERTITLERIFFHLAAETEPLMTDEIEHRLRQAKAAEAWHALIVARRRNLKLYNSNTEE